MSFYATLCPLLLSLSRHSLRLWDLSWSIHRWWLAHESCNAMKRHATPCNAASGQWFVNLFRELYHLRWLLKTFQEGKATGDIPVELVDAKLWPSAMPRLADSIQDTAFHEAFTARRMKAPNCSNGGPWGWMWHVEGPRFDDSNDLEFELEDVESVAFSNSKMEQPKWQLFRFENLGIFSR